MKRMLHIAGILALFAWTAGGLVAWGLTKQGLHVTISEGGEGARQGPSPIALLEDRVTALQERLDELGSGIERGFQTVLEQQAGQDEAEAATLARLDADLSRSDKRAAGQADLLAARVTALQDRVETLVTAAGAAAVPMASDTGPEPQARETTVAEAPVAEAPVAEVPGAEAPGAEMAVEEKAAAEARPRKSFLAFRLSHREFDFATRRAWKIVPSLSRVGFDATSTLHDFSGVSSKVQGGLEADLSRPGDAPKGSIVVDAKTLDTGLEDRNAEMYEHLATKEHPEIRFEILAFTASEVDTAGMKLSGTVKGRMQIRGVTKELEMPVRLAVDSSRRLSIEGEVPVDITDYEVPVPSKLGLIGMDKGVKVWIRLRARLVPRSEG